MRYFASILVLTASTTLVPGLLSAQSCRTADDRSAFMINTLKVAVTSTDVKVIAERQHNGIPPVDTTQITLMATERICSKAAQAYNAALPRRTDGVQPSGQVYVVKVGTVYVVLDPTQTNGEWAIQMVMDSKYKVLSSYGT